jgi:hypothetical protein
MAGSNLNGWDGVRWRRRATANDTGMIHGLLVETHGDDADGGWQ